MDVFLLLLGDRRPVFYSEGSEHREGDEDGSAPSRGLRAWLGRTYRRCRDVVEHSEGGIGRQTRRLRDWLGGFVSPDEPMLRRLRRAGRIRLHHPMAMPGGKALACWEDYLVGRRRHHIFWLAVNLAVCPLSLLLAPVPGPNVIGYWFVYRAACHGMALLGIRRARGLGETTVPLPSDALDLGGAEDWRASVAGRFGLEGLDEFLGRIGVGRGRPGSSPNVQD